MGFEPMNDFYIVNRLAGGPNRPLWHLPEGRSHYFISTVLLRRRERDSNPR